MKFKKLVDEELDPAVIDLTLIKKSFDFSQEQLTNLKGLGAR